MASADYNKKPHALVVPASGQGHVIACMLLARSLAALGFQVSFVYFSSEYAKQRVADSSPENALNIRIHVVEDGFTPTHAHQLFSSTPLMQENLYALIVELRKQGTPLTCFVADTFAPWTLPVAERANLPFINYWTSNAMAYLLVCAVPLLFSQGIFPETGSPTQWRRETPLMLDLVPGLPPFPSELYPQDVRFVDASDPFVCILSEVAKCGKHGERMLIHTMSELEPEAFRSLQVLGIPAYAIGSLLQPTQRQEGLSTSSAQINEQTHDCGAWLDLQAESSVIYIAFGSHARVSAEDIQELALGLEASGSPFLWAIREDMCSGAGLQDVLPDGFMDRISGKGMIISWAPQVEVLAHKAIGGFLTHCGWTSILESLWEGVPMLCCPVFAEQLSNARYLCKVWGAGMELGRTDTGGIERRDVEVGVKGLMQEEEGLKARAKAQELMQITRKTCQQGGEAFINLHKFYEDMKQLISTSSSQ